MLRSRGALALVTCSALLLSSCGGAGPVASAGPAVVLADFDDAGEVAAWTTVDDPVMGGRSTSTVDFAGGRLVFSGTVSLENNGGFASARGPADPGLGTRATGATSLRVHALGDGKTYLLKVSTAGQPWSYVQRFATEPGADRVHELPVEGFRPVGRRLDPAPDAPQTLDPSRIDRLAVYILDKQQGPFQLRIEAIDAVT